MRTSWFCALAMIASITAAACADDEEAGPLPGMANGDPNGTNPNSVAGPIQPSSTVIRRLNRAEYNNTVRDLLGDTTRPADHFAPETRVFGFDNNASALTISPALVEAYLDAAEALASAADLTKLLDCPAASADDACVRKMIDTFGKRAFRRPLVAAEAEDFAKLYTSAKTIDGDSTNAIRAVITRFLQAPQFLYRVELSGQGSTGPAAMDSWEMASRLSYFIWGTMPDDALFAAAQANALVTSDQIAAQTKRMLADPRAKDMVQSFHAQWLGLSEIEKVQKVDPSFAALRPLLAQETSKFVDNVVFGGEGDIATLLSAPFSYVNADLAPFYGATATGPDFVRVALDPKQRAGLLTQGAFLARMAKETRSSPIARGVFVLERMLCRPPVPPPANFSNVAPDAGDPVTTRDFYTNLTSPPTCQNCHRSINGIGFGFERYDALGKYRDTENGKPVDSTGSVKLDGADVPFADGVELARRLAQSQDVQACMVKQWFRFAYGRGESDADQPALDALGAEVTTAKGNVLALVTALTKSDVFLAPNYSLARRAH